MKATGIVRRVDELGRVVIPREIRKNLKIQDGEPLEIFVENNCVIFKKYQNDSTEMLSKNLVEALLKFGIDATVYNSHGEKIHGTKREKEIDPDEISPEFCFPISDLSLNNFYIGYVVVKTVPNTTQKIAIESAITFLSLQLAE